MKDGSKVDDILMRGVAGGGLGVVEGLFLNWDQSRVDQPLQGQWRGGES